MFKMWRNGSNTFASTMNTRRFSNTTKTTTKIDSAVKMVILCRQNLFRKRKWACRLYCISSIYGLMIAFILAEMEVSCLEGHTAENPNQHAKHKLLEIRKLILINTSEYQQTENWHNTTGTLSKTSAKPGSNEISGTETSTQWVQQFDCGALVPDEIAKNTEKAGGDLSEHYLFCNASRVVNGQLMLLRSACQYFERMEYFRVTALFIKSLSNR